jgi:PKD repeat protein
MKKRIKNILFTVFGLLVLSYGVNAQYAYTPEFISGTLNYIPLSNPGNPTIIGTGPNQIGASDFSQDGTLYAISGADNGLYTIDTTNASSTLIGTVNPPGAEFWSGMAMDPTDGTMYVCSTDGNTSSFYTIDLSNGSTTLIGTNAAESGVVGIAFDDAGQMYAIYLVRKFYKIDKTNAVPTFVGDLTAACSALAHHGLDFCSENQTMYLVSYNAFSFDNELYTVDLTTGSNTLIGLVGQWTGSIACEPAVSITADFSAEPTEICEKEQVAFTDLSTGLVTTWSWTFEGGTPATSNEQNPVVLYETAGTYSVSLEVSDGTNTNTTTKPGYITVFAMPLPEIFGETTVCVDEQSDYTTPETPGNTYTWAVTGGIITAGSGTHQITVLWETIGTGNVAVTEDNGDCTASADMDVVVEDCTGQEENTTNASLWKIYPNPVNTLLHVLSPDVISGAIRLHIYNFMGEEIMVSFDPDFRDGNQCTIDMAQVPEGIYILRITNDQGLDLSRKILKR